MFMVIVANIFAYVDAVKDVVKIGILYVWRCQVSDLVNCDDSLSKMFCGDGCDRSVKE